MKVRQQVQLALCGAALASAAAPPPVVHRDATFLVKEKMGIQYAQGILCDPKPCNESWLGIFAAGRPWGTAARQ